MAMDAAQLLEPVLTGGIRDTHFFNGRILTADDLRTMQSASRLHDAQLGRAVGAGVVYGLDVTLLSTDPVTGRVVLRVTSGLAFNQLGDAVALGASIDLQLVIGTEAPVVEGAFTICAPPAPQFINEGLYILTVMPATGLEGRAPMTELGVEGVGSKCASRYAVDGVKFGIVRVTLPAAPAAGSLFAQLGDALLRQQTATLAPGAPPLSDPDLSFVRNAVAYLCYGSEQREAEVRDPLARAGIQSYGLLDTLREAKLLASCEIPLAALLWTPGGIQFLDAWAVRRPVAPTARRRMAEGWAMFRQFQDQIDELLKSGLTSTDLAAIQARQRFRFLPAAGLLPSAAFGVRGFTEEGFFFGLPRRRPEHIDGALLDSLLWASLVHEPIDLEDDELVWVYRFWQNAIPRTGDPPAQPCLVFTSAHVPYLGPARFDVARWEGSNYATSYGV
jgi:hypothetical protein